MANINKKQVKQLKQEISQLGLKLQGFVDHNYCHEFIIEGLGRFDISLDYYIDINNSDIAYCYDVKPALVFLDAEWQKDAALCFAKHVHNMSVKNISKKQK